MPRLARWLFNSFWAAAQLGLTISDCVHLLNPGSPFHETILACLPPLLKAEWSDILRAHGGEATADSGFHANHSNRISKAISAGMFGSHHNHLDVLRMMREGRIVIVNLSSQGRLSGQKPMPLAGWSSTKFSPPRVPCLMVNAIQLFLLLDEFEAVRW